MAGIAVRRTASLLLAYARPSTFFALPKKKDVDARHKAGHDGEIVIPASYISNSL
jgi:hypothetical protein